MANFLVWGGGGHGKVVADVMRSAGMEISGFIDADPVKLGTTVEPGGSRVVISEADFLKAIEQGELPHAVHGVVLGIGSNADRARCRQRLTGTNIAIATHQGATIAPSAKLGPGCVVMPGAIINADATIGAGVIVNTQALVEHDCVVGDDSHIGPGAVIAGGVRVGIRVLVGAGAVIIPGLTVGDDAVVGAGAVVIRNVSAGATVAGNPAKEIIR